MLSCRGSSLARAFQGGMLWNLIIEQRGREIADAIPVNFTSWGSFFFANSCFSRCWYRILSCESPSNLEVEVYTLGFPQNSWRLSSAFDMIMANWSFISSVVENQMNSCYPTTSVFCSFQNKYCSSWCQNSWKSCIHLFSLRWSVSCGFTWWHCTCTHYLR